MKAVRILHLYAQTLDLYGDHKNLDVLCGRIRETGNQATVATAELDEPLRVGDFDMVYIGHGKARNLAAVAEHFTRYGEEIRSAIEGGQVWLSTGNSRELFGRSFTTPSGQTLPDIGLFGYTGVETGRVFVSDMLARPVFDRSQRVYGFANRTAYLSGENQYPLFEVITGFSDGAEPDGREGTLYQNFFATWSMGPVLVRNPPLMREVLKRLLGEDYRACDFSLEQRAADLVFAEFQGK